MQLRINNQFVDLLVLKEHAPLTERDHLLLGRVDHILRANPEFQRQYPRAKLEQVMSCPDHPDCFCFSYTSLHGPVEIHAGRASLVTIDLERRKVTITT